MKYVVVSLVALISGCNAFSKTCLEDGTCSPGSGVAASGEAGGGSGGSGGSGGAAGTGGGGPGGSGSGGDASGGAGSNVPVEGLVAEIVEPLVTHELGLSATFTVKLNAQPTSDVTLAVASSDETEAIASPAALTFSTEDWNVPQAVSVTGLPESGLDGTVDYAVEVRVSASDDGAYRALEPLALPAQNQDWAIRQYATAHLRTGSTLEFAGSSADGTLLSFRDAGQILVWEPQTGKETRYGETVRAGELSRDGRTLVYTEEWAGKLTFSAVELETGDVARWLDDSEDYSGIGSIRISSDARYMAFLADLPQSFLRGAFFEDTRVGAFSPQRVDGGLLPGTFLSAPLPQGISDDGNVIALSAVFERQQALVRVGNDLRAISIADDGQWANTGVYDLRMAGDGSIAVFSSRSTNLTDLGASDSAIYGYDVETDALERLTNFDEALGLHEVAAVSSDGGVIAFTGWFIPAGGESEYAVFVRHASTGLSYRADLQDAAIARGDVCVPLSVSEDLLLLSCGDPDHVNAPEIRYVPLGDAFWQSPLVMRLGGL